MLIGLLLAGNMSGFGGTEASNDPQPAGGRRKAYAESWREHEQHQRRTRWDKEAAEYVKPQTKAKKAEESTQAAQDAPQQPRTAEPAPITPISTAALDELLARAGQLPVAALLADAMQRRMQAEIVQAAMQAEAELAAEEEAVAMLLVLMENA